MQNSEERSLHYSIKEGMAYATMFGIGETYFVAYALFLKASTLDIALLSAIPILLGSLVQLLSVWLHHIGVARKKIVIGGAVLQGALWLPLFFLPPVFPGHAPQLFIALVVLYYMAGNMIAPIWTDWMGDLVPSQKRGRFFAHRTRMINATTFCAMVVGGIILHMNEVAGDQAVGFMAIFIVSAIARYLSAYYLSRMVDPTPKKAKTSTELHVLHLSQMIPHRRALVFTVFVALIQFSTFIAAPYFSVYMLKTLQLDYVVFMSLLAVSVLAQFLTLNYWGKLSDYIGNRLILVNTSIMLPILPLLWLFSDSLLYLVFVQLFAGLTWAGFTLSVNNTLYDIIDPKMRPSFCAFYNVSCNVGIALGALLGGWLASLNIQDLNFFYWQTHFGNSIFYVFLVSGACRLLVVILLIKTIKEQPIPFKNKRNYVRVTRLFPGFMIDWLVKKEKKDIRKSDQ